MKSQTLKLLKTKTLQVDRSAGYDILCALETHIISLACIRNYRHSTRARLRDLYRAYYDLYAQVRYHRRPAILAALFNRNANSR